MTHLHQHQRQLVVYIDTFAGPLLTDTYLGHLIRGFTSGSPFSNHWKGVENSTCNDH